MMITLVEKRLQELENRIPVLLAQIAEQQNKMLEISKFPNDLAEVRKNCEVLSQNLKDHLSKFFDLQSENNGKYIDVQRNQKEAMDLLKILKASDQNLDFLLKSLQSQVSPIQKDAKSALEKHTEIGLRAANLETNSNSYANAITEIKNSLKTHTENINTGIFEINQRREEISKLSNVVVALQDEVKKFKQANMESHNSFFTDISNLKENASSAKENKPKSYDSEIAEIKKDIISILSLMHPTTQVADQSQWEKVKSLENHVAQIYALLKKYEPKA